VKELWSIGTEASVDVLRTCLSADQPGLTTYALGALGQIGTEDAVDGMIGWLKTPRHELVGYTAVLLGKLRARKAVPVLLGYLDCDGLPSQDRRAVISALGEMPHVRAIPALRAALRERRGYRVQMRAASALANIDARESRLALEAAAGELSWIRSLPVRRALRRRRARGLDT
jgi:HEAT repeat protein